MYLQDAICAVASSESPYKFMLRDIIQDIEHTYNSSFKSVEKAMQRSMMYMLDRALPGQYLCDLFYSDGSYETEDVTLKDFIRTAAVEVSKIAC